MKIPVLFLMVAIATVNSPLVHATECTEDDLAKISGIYSQAVADGPSSCPTEAPAANTDEYCSYAACLRGKESIVDDNPICISNGFNLRDGLKAAFDLCEDVATDTSSNSAFATDSSSSSAFVTDTSSRSASTIDSSSSSVFATDASSSSGDSANSSSGSLLRTASPPDSTTSDNITAYSGSSSSSASSISMVLSSAVIAMTASIFAAGL